MVFQTDYRPNAYRLAGLVRMAPHAKEFVENLGPGDRVALLSFGSHLQLRADFTDDHQAIADMIHHHLTEHREQLGEDIMAGTINLVYDHSIPGIQKQLSDLQHEYIDEVISALNVNLEQKQTMSVILVQGPARKLKVIADRMTTCRGVHSGKLLMSTAIIPQLHPLPVADMKQL